MKDRRKTRSVGKTILAVVLTILLLAGAIYFIYAYFQVENIKVKGEHPAFSDSDIAKLAEIEPKTHMFFVDEQEIKERVESEPYLEVLSIEKEYPQTLVIEVNERIPVAMLPYSDQLLLTDENANVLEILTDPPEETYPTVTGFSLDAVNLGKQIATQDSFKVSVYSELIAALRDKGLNETIQTIDLSDVNNIQMYTWDGLQIKFGQADKIADKVKMIKSMIPKLAASGHTGGTLDVTLGISATYQLNGDGEQTTGAGEDAEPSEADTSPQPEDIEE